LEALHRPMVSTQRRPWGALVAALVVLGFGLSAAAYESGWTLRAASPSPRPLFDVTDLTSSLGGAFVPGAIQGFGANSSAVLLTGIGVYNKPAGFTLPVLARMMDGGAGPSVSNLTPQVEPYFHDGGTYGAVWNGSAWLLTGEATWGTLNEGSAVFLSSSGITNLTPTVGAHFLAGGIWIAGWNGTSWLLGGNSSDGAALVSVAGATVTNLSGQIPASTPDSWIQLLAWNGTSWIVGGHGVFGVLSGGKYADLLPGSPFVPSGVYAGAWDGARWIVGGGPPASIAEVSGLAVHPAPSLPAGFEAWVGAIVGISGGWLIVGQGLATSTARTPAMAFWLPGSPRTLDLTALLPASFQGGQPAYAAPAPFLGSFAILLVGWGDYNPGSGLSHGAVAELVPHNGPG
jgi:hypothetical protein